jgi:hypothetical protein
MRKTGQIVVRNTLGRNGPRAWGGVDPIESLSSIGKREALNQDLVVVLIESERWICAC